MSRGILQRLRSFILDLKVYRPHQRQIERCESLILVPKFKWTFFRYLFDSFRVWITVNLYTSCIMLYTFDMVFRDRETPNAIRSKSSITEFALEMGPLWNSISHKMRRKIAQQHTCVSKTGPGRSSISSEVVTAPSAAVSVPPHLRLSKQFYM